MSLIPGVQIWFNIQKSNNVTYDTNRLKKKAKKKKKSLEHKNPVKEVSSLLGTLPTKQTQFPFQ